MASAVPHEPAPRTAIRLGALIRLPAARRCSAGPAVARRSIAHRLCVERVEVDRLEQQLGKPALADDVGDRLASEWVERVGAKAADEHGTLLGRVALEHEYAGLRHLDEEQRRVVVLGLDGECESDLGQVRTDFLRACPDIELRLRRNVRREYARRLGRLERQVLDVDLLQHELLLGGRLRLFVCHWYSSRSYCVERLGCGGRGRGEQRIELAALVERAQVVVAANVPAVDEYLGYGLPAAAALDHLELALAVEEHVDLRERRSLLGQQTLGRSAITAERRRVDDDALVGHAHFTSGRFSVRQVPRPPRRLKTFS